MPSLGMPPLRRISARTYYRRTLRHAFKNFEYHEPTISHTLRSRHPWLRGQTFGEAFFKAVRRHAAIGGRTSVLELGGGCGDFAHSFLRAWRSAHRRWPTAYTILDLSPALLRSQQHHITHGGSLRLMQGDAHTLPFQDHSIDGLVIANEMIADLDAWEVGRQAAGNGRTPLHTAQLQTDIRRYRWQPLLRHPGAVLPTGAIRLLEELHRVLREPSSVVLTEYFDLERAGRVVSMETHTECQLSLDVLCQAAQRIGFSVRTMPLVDFLDMDMREPVVSKSLMILLNELLGHAVPITEPMSVRRLSRQAGLRLNRHADGLIGRAELQNFLSVFYVILLAKRRRLSAVDFTEPLVVHKEPAVRSVQTPSGDWWLLRGWPLTGSRLNATGYAVWEQINGRRSAGQIALRIARQHRIASARALADTLAFLRSAYQRSYVS